MQELHHRGQDDDRRALGRAERQRATSATNRTEWEGALRLTAAADAAAAAADAAQERADAAAREAAAAGERAAAAREAAARVASSAPPPPSRPAATATAAEPAAAAAPAEPAAAPAEPAQPPEHLNARGRRLFQSGDLVNAVNAWRQVLLEDHEHAGALCNLAQAMRLVGDPAGAERAATELLALPEGRATAEQRVKAKHR